MTGLIYGLMKAWPEKVIALVYALLVKQWNSSSMHEFMKWRWMCPIPKKQGGVRMTDLRPYRWSKMRSLEDMVSLGESWNAGQLAERI